jgi:large conductance mechanosensitive channel
VFMLIKGINKLQREQPTAPTAKDCPYCFSAIPIKATRCPQCTSDLGRS